MQPERGTQTVIGIVLAVTLLWTIAILIPGGGRVTVDPNRAFATPQLGLVINGTHYVLDANVRRYQAGDDENFHIIHAQSPEKAQRVSIFLFALVYLHAPQPECLLLT